MAKKDFEQHMMKSKKHPASLHYSLFHLFLNLPSQTMEKLSFFRQTMTRKTVLGSRRIRAPKTMWAAKQLLCRRMFVSKQITPFTPPSSRA